MGSALDVTDDIFSRSSGVCVCRISPDVRHAKRSLEIWGNSRGLRVVYSMRAVGVGAIYVFSRFGTIVTSRASGGRPVDRKTNFMSVPAKVIRKVRYWETPVAVLYILC